MTHNFTLDAPLVMSNSQRADKPWVAYIKQQTRHSIETLFSKIK